MDGGSIMDLLESDAEGLNVFSDLTVLLRRPAWTIQRDGNDCMTSKTFSFFTGYLIQGCSRKI